MPIYFTNYKDALHDQLRVKQNQDLSRKKLYIHTYTNNSMLLTEDENRVGVPN